MCEIMRYRDDDHPGWDAEEHAFAAAWRNLPKRAVSRSLKSVGPNARLVEDDLEVAIRELKGDHGRRGHETLVTVRLVEREGRTEMRFRQRVFRSAESRDSHRGGWSACFDRLDAYLGESR